MVWGLNTFISTFANEDPVEIVQQRDAHLLNTGWKSSSCGSCVLNNNKCTLGQRQGTPRTRRQFITETTQRDKHSHLQTIWSCQFPLLASLWTVGGKSSQTEALKAQLNMQIPHRKAWVRTFFMKGEALTMFIQVLYKYSKTALGSGTMSGFCHLGLKMTFWFGQWLWEVHVFQRGCRFCMGLPFRNAECTWSSLHGLPAILI